MDPYSKLQSDRLVGLAHLRQLREEARVRGIIRETAAAPTPWRIQLATQLHRLAERIEPTARTSPEGTSI